MAKRPSTLECPTFSVASCRKVDADWAHSRSIVRTRSVPAVSCRRRRRRCCHRPLTAHAGSSDASLHDRGDVGPEVEFSPEVPRSRSTANVVGLSSSRSDVGAGGVTATTSFQTCVDVEEDDDDRLTSTSVDTHPPLTDLHDPSPCRRHAVPATSFLSPGLRPPRVDSRRLCPPGSGSRGRRSASMSAVRPSTVFRSQLNNYNTAFGEPLTSSTLDS